jgi:hypothetical protein
MKAQCIQECWHGTLCIKFTPDGGPNKDGVYDVDPLDPIAQYFEFPKGTVKYQKVLGKRGKEENKETTITVGENDKRDDEDIPAIKAKLKELGIVFHPATGKEKLLALLNNAPGNAE